MRKRAKISAKTRAAVIADLLAGEQPAVVALKHGIDAAYARVLKQRHVTQGDTFVTPVTMSARPALDAQKAYIGELILDVFRAKLEASQALAIAVRQPDWIVKQSASQLAELGQWLDSSAFAIGDRLAGRPADRSAEEPDA